jgi:hypothetical protein
MSQAIDSGYNGGGNAYPFNVNPSSAMNGSTGNPNNIGNLNQGLPGSGAPLLGAMQGFGGVDGFNSSAPSEQNLSNLLNIEPLQQQSNQLSQGGSTDPSSPLNYVNSKLTPIMSGAQQSYKQGLSQAQQPAPKKQTEKKQTEKSGTPA